MLTCFQTGDSFINTLNWKHLTKTQTSFEDLIGQCLLVFSLALALALARLTLEIDVTTKDEKRILTPSDRTAKKIMAPLFLKIL